MIILTWGLNLSYKRFSTQLEGQNGKYLNLITKSSIIFNCLFSGDQELFKIWDFYKVLGGTKIF